MPTLQQLYGSRLSPLGSAARALNPSRQDEDDEALLGELERRDASGVRRAPGAQSPGVRQPFSVSGGGFQRPQQRVPFLSGQQEGSGASGSALPSRAWERANRERGGGELDGQRVASGERPEIPELDRSMISRLGETAGGGLAAAANILDLPGSSVRDLIALPADISSGKPMSEWSNPFDQWLTPTSHDNRVTGRELARKYGAADDEDTYANWFGGLGLEIGLDPLTYTGIGALTKGGQAARKAGLFGRGGRKFDRESLKRLRPSPVHKSQHAFNRSAERLAAESGNVLGREMGRRGAKMRMTPRQLIEVAEDPEAAMKAFQTAGGTDDLLDLPVQSLASFRVPGLMKEPAHLLPKDYGQEAVEKFAKRHAEPPPPGSAVGAAGDAPPPPPGADPIIQAQGGPKWPDKTGDITDPKEAGRLEKLRQSWKESLPEGLASNVADAIDAGVGYAYKVPGVNELVALFNPAVRDGLSKMGRELGEETDELLQQATYGYRELLAPIVKEFENSKLFDARQWVREGLTEEQAIEKMNNFDRSIRNYLENYDPKVGKTGTVLSTELSDLEPQLRAMRTLFDDIIEFEGDSGLDVSSLTDEFASYLSRYRRMPGRSYSHNPTQGPVYEVSHPAMNQRKYRDLPGGVEVIQEASIDPRISGIIHSQPVVRNRLEEGQIQDLREYVAENYGNRLSKDFDMDEYMQNIDSDTSLDWFIKSMANLERFYVDTQTPLFGRDIVGDLSRRLQDGLRSGFMARASQELLGKMAQPVAVTEEAVKEATGRALQRGEDVDEAVKGAGQVYSVLKVLQDKKIDTPRSAENVIEFMSPEMKSVNRRMLDAASDQVERELLAEGGKRKIRYEGRKGDLTFEGGMLQLRRPQRNARKEIIKGDDGKTVYETLEFSPDELPNLLREEVNREFVDMVAVSPEVNKQLTRWLKPYSQPEVVGNVTTAMRRFLNVFRTGQTAMWPAFHSRNFISAQIMNAMLGAKDPSVTGPGKAVMQYFRPIKQAYDLRSGRQLDGLASEADIFRGMSDEEATEQLRQLSFKYGVTGDTQGIAAEHIGHAQASSRSQFPGMNRDVNPFKGQLSPEPVGTTRFDRWFPLAVRDGFTVGDGRLQRVTDDRFIGARAGRDVAAFTEELNRLAPFIAFIKQGYEPRVAADMSKKLQVDYSRLTSFEREKMRNLIPFYTFSRNMLPVTAEELVMNPGGPMRQSIRAIDRMRDPEANVPEHVASTAAIPTGVKPDGTQSYLTGFGLAFEDSLGLADGVMRMDPVESMRELAGRSSPLVKAPMEAMFGRSLYFDGPLGGRELSELDPPVGRTLSNIRDLATGQRTKQVEPFLGDWFEFGVSNSPFARAASTARTLTDPRKIIDRPVDTLLNVGTGVRMRDVSPNEQDAVYRARLARALKDMGGRTFTRPYISDSREKTMTPEQLESAERVLDELGVIDKRFRTRRELEEAAEEGVDNVDELEEAERRPSNRAIREALGL